MSDDTEKRRRAEEDVDPGEPIAALAELRVETSTRFLGRVRRSIERRSLGSSLVVLAWYAPALIMIEFLAALLGPRGGNGSGPDR